MLTKVNSRTPTRWSSCAAQESESHAAIDYKSWRLATRAMVLDITLSGGFASETAVVDLVSAAASCYQLRAVRVDPMVALRNE